MKKVSGLVVLFLLLPSFTSAQAENVTYYEHAAYPGQFFNATPYFGTAQNRSVLAFNNTETLIIKFTKDVAEGGSGLLLPAQTIAFYGYFSALEADAAGNVSMNWQLIDYNPSTGMETQVCRTPTGTSGAILQTASGTLLNRSCTLASGYFVAPEHKLRVAIYVYNTNPTKDFNVIHWWDTTTYASKYELKEVKLGVLNIDLVSPTTNIDFLSQGSAFNQTCQASCSGGWCYNVSVYAQYMPSDGSWKDTDFTSTNNLVLNAGETNPHNVGDISSPANTTFAIYGNIVSKNNSIRCRAESKYSNATGATVKNVSVVGAFVRTNKSSYLTCGAVYYKISLFNYGGEAVDSQANIQVLNTSREVKNESNVNTTNGVYYGIYPLPSLLDYGEWLIRVYADGVLKKMPFLVGYGSREVWKIDMVFNPNKARYNRSAGDLFYANFSIYNLLGEGIAGLWPSGMNVKIGATTVGSGVNDLGKGLYSYLVNTSLLTANNTYDFHVTAWTNVLNVTSEKSFYVTT